MEEKITHGTIRCALHPPIIGAVNHRPSSRFRVVRIHETLDPRYHRGVGQPVAGCAGGVVFDVEHAREGDPVCGPAAAVGEAVREHGSSALRREECERAT